MSASLALRACLFLVLLVGLGGSGILRRRADRAGGEVPRSADGPWIAAGLRVAGLIFWGSVLAWLLYPAAVGWAGLPLPAAARWVGLALVGGGIALGLWALWHLGLNVTPTAVARSDAELVTDGPYRWVRHPLYTSGFLSLPGCALVTANLLVLASGAVALALVVYRTRREERELIVLFGDRYVEYRRRTGRILPRVRRAGGGRTGGPPEARLFSDLLK